MTNYIKTSMHCIIENATFIPYFHHASYWHHVKSAKTDTIVYNIADLNQYPKRNASEGAVILFKDVKRLVTSTILHTARW